MRLAPICAIFQPANEECKVEHDSDATGIHASDRISKALIRD